MEIQVHDKIFIPLIKSVEIKQKIQQLAVSLRQDYQGLNPLVVSVLNGSFIFAADLFREINQDWNISFTKIKSYTGTSGGQLKSFMELEHSFENRHVLILEDIVDSGRTIEFLFNDFKNRGCLSVEVACLLFKPAALQTNISVKYRCFDIGNEFVVGYGLDYNEKGRHLDSIFVLKEDKSIRFNN